MKQVIKSIFALFVALSAFVSCVKEAANNEPLYEVTLIAGNPEALPATKTEMSGTKPYWSVDDKIGVSTGTSGNYLFETGIAAPAATASFSGSSVSGTLYAYYPYSEDGIKSASGTTGARVNLVKDQNPTASSFDGAADIMVAKSFEVNPANTTVDNLQFARLGAIVKIVLIDKNSVMTGTQYVSSISMTAETALAGYVIVDMVNQSMTDPYYNTSTTVTGSYSNETHFAINGTNGAYLIVAPQTLAAGSTLTIAAATNDYTISKEITVPAGGIELLPGKVNTLKISLTGNQITAKPDPYELFTDAIEEGEYLIVSDGAAMKASISSNRFQYTAVSITENQIYNPDANLIWHIAQSGSYWTIYNDDSNSYAAGNNTNNQGALLDSVTDYALWSFDYDSGWTITNKGNAESDKNAVIRRNGTYGFACYGASTGTAPVLYKLNDGKASAGISYSPTSASITIGDALTQPTLNNVHELSVSYESNNTAVATVASDGVISVIGVGEAVITCSWDEQTISNTTYRAGSVTYTLTVNNVSVDYVTLPWSYPESGAATKDGIQAVVGVTAVGLGSDYAESNSPYRIKFDNDDDNIQVKTDNSIGAVSVSYKMIGGANTSTLNILESTDGSTWTAVQDLSISGAANSTGVVTTTNLFNSASRYVKINFTKGSNVGIGGISITLADGKSDAGISYSPASATFTYGEFTQPTLSNEHNLSVSYASNNTDVATVAANGAISVVGCGEATITCSWNEQTVGNVTYRSGSATYALTVNKIPVTVAFSEPNTAVAVGNTVTNVASTTPSGLSLTYSSSATGVATVTNAGVVTGVANGNATITASYAGDATHESASANYQITVGSANDGSQAHPFTVAEVRAYMDASSSNRGPVYISGIVSSVYAEYDKTHGTGIFYISDDGETSSDQFEAYSVKFLGNVAWTDGNTQIAVGNEVIIYGGELTIYNSTIYETKSNSGSYLYSLNGNTDTETVPTITKTDITGVSADGVTNANTTVSFSNNTGWTVAVTCDGEIVTSASISSSTITYSVDSNSGSARTGSITVTLSKSSRTDVTAVINVSQLAGNSGGGDKSWTLVTDASTLSAGDVIVFAAYNVTYKASGVNYTDNKVMGAISNSLGTPIDVTFSSDGTSIPELPSGAQQYTLGGSTGAWTIKNGSKYLTKGANKVTEETSSYTWTISISSNNAIVTSVDEDTFKLQYNPNSGNGRFATYSSNQKAIRIYRYE